MLETIFTGIYQIVESVFLEVDTISAVAAVVVAIAAGFMMKKYAQVAYVTLGALLAYAFVNYLRGVIELYDSPVRTGNPFLTQLEYTWNAFMGMTVGYFLVYFIAFFVVISIVYAVRSAMKG